MLKNDESNESCSEKKEKENVSECATALVEKPSSVIQENSLESEFC